MGFWHWLKGDNKTRRSNNQRQKPLDPQVARAFGRVKQDIKKLQKNLTEINVRLAEHNHVLTGHTQLLETHTAHLDGLEQLVNTAAPVSPVEAMEISQPNSPTNRPNETTNRLVTTSPVINRTEKNLDIQSLSPQEKRILQVFLTHRDMALSYQDIAKSLNKSPNTIKNQIRQMNMKSSLFDKTLDANSKNRFKLRKHLKIETDLDTD